MTDAKRTLTLDAFGRWMVRSNVRRIREEGLDGDVVVVEIRANGYPSVADAVAAELGRGSG